MTALQPLWQIDEDLQALLDSVALCPDEYLQELQARIAEYTAQGAVKVDQIAHVLAALDYEQKAAADEITRLQDRKKAAAAAKDRLEQYVCRVIKARGVKALEGNTNTLSVRPSEAVKITDEAAMPDQWKTVTVKMPSLLWYRIRELGDIFGPPGTARELAAVAVAEAVSVAEVKKDLKAGIAIPGADLEYRNNLQRK